MRIVKEPKLCPPTQRLFVINVDGNIGIKAARIKCNRIIAVVTIGLKMLSAIIRLEFQMGLLLS